MSLPNRNEIPEALTWDLSYLFETPVHYEEAVGALNKQVKDFAETYQDKIANSHDSSLIIAAIQDYEQMAIIIDHCGNYVSLAASVDYGNQENGERELLFSNLYADLNAQMSFFDAELKQVSEITLSEVAKQAPNYQNFIQDLIEAIPHTLSPESERLLAEFRPLFELPEYAYQQTKLADMTFESFEAEGETKALSFVLYENNYCHSTDTETRRKSFKNFSETLAKYKHTIAADYFARVQAEKTESRLRGFDSVIDMLLDRQKVSLDLYNRQIDLIMSELAPHMRRYAKLLQRYYGLDEIRYSDLKLAFDPAYSPKVDLADAKTYIKEALAVFGSEYSGIVEQALQERRIDYAQNAGKSTGGFCASPYQKGGYILLNWGGELSEVFTLAHELGHLAHFTLAQDEQAYLASECSWYLVEAPSTCNEMLLSNYLLDQNSEDARFRRWVMASMVSNTYCHNFVTHLLEAAYQREVYRAVDAGKVLQADDLSAIFQSVLEEFWGDAVVLDEGSELTWMRQPHYYSGLYPYTYSAGLTISTAVSRRIVSEGQLAVDDWLAALRAGGTLRPLDFALKAGVAIDTDQPLRETIAYIGDLISEVDALLPASETFQK